MKSVNYDKPFFSSISYIAHSHLHNLMAFLPSILSFGFLNNKLYTRKLMTYNFFGRLMAAKGVGGKILKLFRTKYIFLFAAVLVCWIPVSVAHLLICPYGKKKY